MITVDLFSGAGGLSLGCSRAGLDVVAAYDSWDKAVANYNANFDHPCVQLDLADHLGASRLVAQHNPDVIVGGPPCQEFSQAGVRSEGNKADLTLSYAKIIQAVRPKYFIMENVDRAMQSTAYARARAIFKEEGYGLSENVLDASLCGVPQKRKRFFCVGAVGAPDGFLDDDLRAGQSERPMTVRDYFGDRLGVQHYYRHPRSYARRGVFSIDEPSATIRGTSRPVPPGYTRHANDSADPSTVRPLTLIERAQIQTFPEDFKWVGPKTAQEQMVGNAVPVILGQYVASALVRYA